MFAKEGYTLIAIAAILAAVLALVGFQLSIYWRVPFLVLAAVILGFTLYFFRDPHRTPPDEAAEGHLILAPADGKVIVVDEDVHEPLYIEGPAKQVSIFLSPLNVHVNRIPVSGTVEYVRYVPGEYLVAWHPKSSELNERSEIGVMHTSGARVLFKQIAGAVARRIVYHLKEGDEVVAGERFGIVKFGSRMDVFVPSHAEISVAVGEHVKAGESILGYLPESAGLDSTASVLARSESE